MSYRGLVVGLLADGYACLQGYMVGNAHISAVKGSRTLCPSDAFREDRV